MILYKNRYSLKDSPYLKELLTHMSKEFFVKKPAVFQYVGPTCQIPAARFDTADLVYSYINDVQLGLQTPGYNWNSGQCIQELLLQEGELLIKVNNGLLAIRSILDGLPDDIEDKWVLPTLDMEGSDKSYTLWVINPEISDCAPYSLREYNSKVDSLMEAEKKRVGHNRFNAIDVLHREELSCFFYPEDSQTILRLTVNHRLPPMVNLFMYRCYWGNSDYDSKGNPKMASFECNRTFRRMLLPGMLEDHMVMFQENKAQMMETIHWALYPAYEGRITRDRIKKMDDDYELPELESHSISGYIPNPEWGKLTKKIKKIAS